MPSNYGDEWQGVPPSRKPKKSGASKGSFKFKHSKGANSSASRFGMDEPAPRRNPARRPRVGMGITGGKGVLRKGR